jgi:TRAP-type uncharacterized transport system substrate-binding protein
MRWSRVAFFALVLGLAVFAVVRALPPRSVTIETGPVDGSYYNIAQQYRDVLRKRGITLVLRANPQSLDIVGDVDRAGSGVDIGFTAQPIRREQYPNTEAAGAVELQPLFIFYNAALGEVATPTNLRGLRLVMPPERSATTEAALRLLRLYDITQQNTRLTFMPLADAVRALKAGQFDAGFFMLAPSNSFIADLLNADNLRLLNLADAKGLTRHLPFLRAVTLARSSYDVENNVPPNDVDMLAATVDVVVRKDIDPAVLYTLLDAMAQVHHGSTLISDAGDFPSIVGTDLVPHPLAVSYTKSGMPWIYRELPLPLARLIDSYLVIAILIFAVTEIYKSLKYLAEMSTVVVETMCVRVLLGIERKIQSGRPITGLRHGMMRVAETVLARDSKRKRGQELLDRIRRYADPGA